MIGAPLIPYFEVPELLLVPAGALGGQWPTVPVTAKPFGALVATGVLLGVWLVRRHGQRLGLDERALMSVALHLMLGGFIGAHVFGVLWYFPERVVDDPWALLRIWEGLSSYGGFLGGTLGVIWWRWRWRTRLLPYADVLASAFPVGWVFGRLGCAMVHDHPGMATEAWYAVAFPGGGRLDLGLLELVATIPLALAFLWLRRRPRAWGTYCGAMILYYAPLRFCLDFLRARAVAPGVPVVDARYAGLTPAQWGCVVCLPLGLWLLLAARRHRGQSPEPPPSVEPPRGLGSRVRP